MRACGDDTQGATRFGGCPAQGHSGVMQVEEILAEGLKRQIRITIPARDLVQRYEGYLDDLGARASLKGFRPGKVPKSYLRRVYGSRAVSELTSTIIQESGRKALQDRNERPALDPQVKLGDGDAKAAFDGEQDLDFRLDYETTPEFELMDFRQLSLQREVASVSDEQISAQITLIARGQRKFSPKKGTAGAGERVTLSYKGTIDGEAFEGGEASDVKLVIGENTLLEEFETQLIGLAAGEEKTISVTFPADYHARPLREKNARFAITVSSVEKAGDVKLDDSFATDLGFQSWEDFKSFVRDRMVMDYQRRSDDKLKQRLLDAIEAHYDFELPSGLVDLEFAHLRGQLDQKLKQSGKSFDEKDPEFANVQDDMLRSARRRVRVGLVLSRVGEEHKLQVSEDEVQGALNAHIQQFGDRKEEALRLYRENPQMLEQIRGPLYERKVSNFLLALAKINEMDVSRDELFADDQAVKAQSPQESPAGPAKKPAQHKAGTQPKAKTKKAASKTASGKDEASRADTSTAVSQKKVGARVKKSRTAKSAATDGKPASSAPAGEA